MNAAYDPLDNQSSLNAAEGFLSWVLFSFPGDESVGESEARMTRWERTAPALVLRDGLNRSHRLGYPLAAFIPTSSIQLLRTDHVPGPPTRRREEVGEGKQLSHQTTGVTGAVE